jgi:rfaE bifunctional protein nucleotidyltransferase chain/domain
MREKIISAEQAVAIAEALRARKGKLVFTNGCFDLVHVGHVRYLAAARALGDALLVAVNGDDSVRALKGNGRPINREADRAEVVAALESVDHVVIFPEVRATALLEKVRPSIYVKGGDYTAKSLDSEERSALEAIGAEIRILPFEPGYSTSSLLEKSRERKGE